MSRERANGVEAGETRVERHRRKLLALIGGAPLLGCSTNAPTDIQDLQIAAANQRARQAAYQIAGIAQPQSASVSPQFLDILGKIPYEKTAAVAANRQLEGNVKLPEFDDQAPEPSTTLSDLELLVGQRLNDLDQNETCRLLCGALINQGYSGLRFVRCRGGYATLTVPERFGTTGESWPAGERFTSDSNSIPWWDLTEVARRLILPARTNWRVFVFTVGDGETPIPRGSERSGLARIYKEGTISPPAQQKGRPAPQKSVLVYELSSISEKAASILRPGTLDAKAHLERSGLVAAFKRGLDSIPLVKSKS